MHIGIIVHSESGTTLAFAGIIAHELKKYGHAIEQTHLKTDLPTHPRSTGFTIVNTPDIAGCDLILFGGPVWAFTASPVIVACIRELAGDLRGKKVIPFATMGFPFAFMGGLRALSRMAAAATAAGADVLPGAVAQKLFHNIRNRMLENARQIATMVH